MGYKKRRGRKKRSSTYPEGIELGFGLFILAMLIGGQFFDNTDAGLMISFLMAGVIWWVIRKVKRKAMWNGITMKEIDAMNVKGTEFEVLVAKLYQAQGYRAEVTPPSGDYGADVILSNYQNKRVCIQAKCYGEGEKVGVKAIQEVYTSLRYWHGQEGWVITNRSFTPNAEKLAKKCNVKLIAREGVERLLCQAQSMQEQKSFLPRKTFSWIPWKKREPEKTSE